MKTNRNRNFFGNPKVGSTISVQGFNFGLILRRINAYCGTAAVQEGAAVDEVVYCGSRSTRDTLLSLVYCGSCTAAKAALYIVKTYTTTAREPSIYIL